MQNGTLFPNTLLIKKTIGLSWGENLQFFKTVMFLSTYNGFYEEMVASFIQMSLWETIRQFIPVFGLSLLAFALFPAKLFIPFTTAIVHIIALKLKHPGVAEWQRYLTLEHTLTIISMAISMSYLQKLLASRMQPTTARAAFFSVWLAVGALFISDLSWHAQARNIISRYFYSLDFRTGEWLAANAAPTSRVGLYQAGGVKFYSQLYALDFSELMSPKLWDYKIKKAGYQAILDYRLDYLAEFGRDFLAEWGIPDTEDPRFFHPILNRGYSGRGLVEVDRQAISNFLTKQASPGK